MAITSDKLLNRPSELHRRYAGRLAMKEDLQKRMVQGGSTNIVLTKKSIKSIDIIKDRVIEIDSLLKGTLAIEKKKLDTQRRQESGKRREKEEEKLETKPQAEKKPIKAPSLPRMGFFAWVKNFIGNIILGYFAVRLVKFLPLAVPIVKFIGKATDFVIDIGGKLLDGLATFIDWGYKAIDFTRGMMKNLGGMGAVKAFDGFTGAVGNLVEIAIIAATVIANQGDGGGNPLLDMGQEFIEDKIKNRLLQRAGQTVAQQAGQQVAGQVGRTATLGVGAVAGIVAGVGLISSAVGEFGFQVRKVAIKPIQDLEKSYKEDKNPLTKFGKMLAFGMVKPLYNLYSIAGFLLDVIGAPFRYAIELLRYPFLSEEDKQKQAKNLAKFDARIREDLRKALNMLTLGFAFKEQGSFGNIYGDKGAQKEMMGTMSKMAGGGRAPTTRGGKSVGTPVTRTIKKQKTKRTLKVQPTEINPGKSVGGVDKLRKIFPGDVDKPTKDKVNPLGYMKSSYNKFSGIPGFGGLASLFMKAQLGERPSDIDYQNAAAGIEGWMQRTFSDEVLRTGGGFAEGGQVDAGMFSSDGDMKNMIAKSIQDSVAPKIDDIINDLMKQLGLKKMSPDDKAGGKGTDSDLPPGTGSLTGNTNAEKVFNYLIGYGFTPQAAAGVIGNLMQESGVNPNSNQGGGGAGRGIMQWGTGAGSGGRWDALTAWAQSSGKDPRALDTQVEWMMREMNQRGTIKRLKGLTNVKAATDLFEKEMEGAGTPMMEKRYSFAADALASFGGGGAGGLGMDKGGVGGTLAEYITGDPNTPFGRFDKAGHGTTSNYHDHIGFKDRATAERAYNFFKSKGIKVTEFKGYDSVGGHASGSLHYSGLAFDVPGSQWGGSGAIGSKEYTGSNKVRGVLKQFLGGSTVAMSKGGRISKPTRTLIGEKGSEFVFDADTTRELTSLAPGLLEKLNFATNKSQIASILQSYTSYEQPYGEPQVVEVPVPMPIPMGGGDESSGGFMPMGGGEESSSFDALYIGG